MRVTALKQAEKEHSTTLDGNSDREDLASPAPEDHSVNEQLIPGGALRFHGTSDYTAVLHILRTYTQVHTSLSIRQGPWTTVSVKNKRYVVLKNTYKLTFW